MLYQKCLEDNQDMLTADMVIEIATDIYNIATVKDRLCRLSAQHRQQTQTYNKGQLKFTSYKKITEKIENQKRDMERSHFPRQRWNEAARLLLLRSKASSSKV